MEKEKEYNFFQKANEGRDLHNRKFLSCADIWESDNWRPNAYSGLLPNQIKRNHRGAFKVLLLQFGHPSRIINKEIIAQCHSRFSG